MTETGYICPSTRLIRNTKSLFILVRGRLLTTTQFEICWKFQWQTYARNKEPNTLMLLRGAESLNDFEILWWPWLKRPWCEAATALTPIPSEEPLRNCQSSHSQTRPKALNDTHILSVFLGQYSNLTIVRRTIKTTVSNVDSIFMDHLDYNVQTSGKKSIYL